MAYVIGITGGIASGKSIVSHYVEELGYKVIDADLIAHDVVDIGSQGLASLVKKFTKDILDEQGYLDRKRLGEMVFSDENKRKLLNQILHPLIREAVERELEKSQETIIFLIVPLLYEANFELYCNEVWLITAPELQRLDRIQKRDKLSREEAYQRIQAQMSDEEKIQRGPIVLENNGEVSVLKAKVDKLLESR